MTLSQRQQIEGEVDQTENGSVILQYVWLENPNQKLGVGSVALNYVYIVSVNGIFLLAQKIHDNLEVQGSTLSCNIHILNVQVPVLSRTPISLWSIALEEFSLPHMLITQ